MSLVIVYIRRYRQIHPLPLTLIVLRYYFEKKFEHIIETVAANKKVRISDTREGFVIRWCRSLIGLVKSGQGKGIPLEQDSNRGSSEQEDHRSPKKLRTDMIRRMDDAPKLVNPSGWISEGDRIPLKQFGTIHAHETPQSISSPSILSPANE